MATRRPPWDLLEEKDAELLGLHDQLDQMAFSDGRLPGRIRTNLRGARENRLTSGKTWRKLGAVLRLGPRISSS